MLALHEIGWAPSIVAVTRRWPVLLQNINSEESKPSSTTSNSSSQSKVSKKVRYSKKGEISFNLLRIIKYSNIIYLTDICFNNNGLKVEYKKLYNLISVGISDLSEIDVDVIITSCNIIGERTYLCHDVNFLQILNSTNVLSIADQFILNWQTVFL